MIDKVIICIKPTTIKNQQQFSKPNKENDNERTTNKQANKQTSNSKQKEQRKKRK